MVIPYSFSNIKTSALTVGTTATQVASSDVMSHQRAGRNAVAVYNASTTATIYWGGADVTTSTGIPIAHGEVMIFPVKAMEDKAIYLVAAASTDIVIAELFD